MTKPRVFNIDPADQYAPSGNERYLEVLYDTYLTDKTALLIEWQRYFDEITRQLPRAVEDVPQEPIRHFFYELSQFPEAFYSEPCHLNTGEMATIEMETAFRRLGHLEANIDPLGLMQRQHVPALALDHYAGVDRALYERLRKTYCRTIGFEYMHINRAEEVEWIRARIENDWAHFKPNADIQKHLLKRLVAADGFEKYLGFKYVGQKRFSLEGGDSLIPLLDTLVERGSASGVKEIVIGMAHRGRLNVMINVLGKAPAELFASFEGKQVATTDEGDVKYHLGYSSNVKTASGTIHLSLAFNPSHLEIVSPVVQGSVRARQRRRRNASQEAVVPIQIHGDSAFAGQGVVMETFSMSQARWFTVGGSVHIVINNQIGFTTSNPHDTRSTMYCTDVAKMVEAPILHVNADDPEAVYFAALFAMDYRLTFKRDVVIDLVCYRRQGHNEADEPSATQPLMYQAIKALPVPYQRYASTLQAAGVLDEASTKALVDGYRQAMDNNHLMATLDTDPNAYEYSVNWTPYMGSDWRVPVKTAVPLETLKELAHKMAALPEGFVVQTQVKKMLEAQHQMTEEAQPINWGYAEIMAYATLLVDNYPIRLCGQDAERGTFAHRHAVLHDQKTDAIYIPLSHLKEAQAQINIIDSLLSEEAVLAFEYGYAAAVPTFLVIWEAQFGDFANGAQVVIDQFISSGGAKWGRYSGLVMFLPHGYEGQGPEHSSARLERYLQLCARDNMQVCMLSTPAQIFHVLRRQMLRPYRRPLIIMTPKSMLRNPDAVSSLKELAEGTFQTIIPEVEQKDATKIEQVVLCSGKIYYELLKERRAKQLNHIAIVRVEQLYPFDDLEAKAIFASYRHVKDIVWCQEEPKNMGAWMAIQPYLLALLEETQTLRYAGRPASASPAAGYHHQHEVEQKQLIQDALQRKPS